MTQPSPSGARSPDGAGPTVSSRLLALLDMFTEARPRLTLSELSRLAGMPLSTTHRLVGELVEWGALERDEDGRFHIGLKVWELGSLAPQGLPLREVALPLMEDLYEATHENVQLSVLGSGGVVFVERIAGRDAVPTLVRVGGRFAIHATGGGLVLLAHAPAAFQEEVLAGPLEAFTPLTVCNPAELRRVLAEIRLRGYALSDRQVTMDALSVAAPILGADDEVAASLSLVVWHETAEPRYLVPLVRSTARSISRLLGAPSAQKSTTARQLEPGG